MIDPFANFFLIVPHAYGLIEGPDDEDVTFLEHKNEVLGNAIHGLLDIVNDFARVGTLQYTKSVGQARMNWLNIKDGHHGLCHESDKNEDAVDKLTRINKWFAGELAYLAKRLAETPEPGGSGSLLDNTVVLWAKEMGDSRLHNCDSVPFILAGGSSSPFSLGRYLQLGNIPHNHLLVSICESFGLSNQTFGDPSVGSGSISELFA